MQYPATALGLLPDFFLKNRFFYINFCHFLYHFIYVRKKVSHFNDVFVLSFFVKYIFFIAEMRLDSRKRQNQK